MKSIFCDKFVYLRISHCINQMSLLSHNRPGNIQRRGFKSSLLSTARGFGKRGGSLFSKGIIPTTAINFGKRSAPPGLNIRAAMYAKDHPR